MDRPHPMCVFKRQKAILCQMFSQMLIGQYGWFFESIHAFLDLEISITLEVELIRVGLYSTSTSDGITDDGYACICIFSWERIGRNFLCQLCNTSHLCAHLILCCWCGFLSQVRWLQAIKHLGRIKSCCLLESSWLCKLQSFWPHVTHRISVVLFGYM